MKKKLQINIFLIIIIVITLFVFKTNSLSAQGTFDCAWQIIQGSGYCGALKIRCDSGFEPNYAVCRDQTPSGKGACDSYTNINCVAKEVPPPNSPLGGNCDSDELDTAIGCIPLDETDFIKFILQWAISLGGGVAFLLIVLASFQIMTSQGDPKRLEAGKELLNSALMGLILLIFSVTILRIIGVDIFHITGF